MEVGQAINQGSMFSTTGIMQNAPIVAVLGAVLFFLVAHPFVFKLVDSIIESVIGTNTQRDLLVLIHSIVFGILMFGSMYLINVLNNNN